MALSDSRRVLEAIRLGHATTPDIELALGTPRLTKQDIAGAISTLRRRGYIRVIGTEIRKTYVSGGVQVPHMRHRKYTRYVQVACIEGLTPLPDATYTPQAGDSAVDLMTVSRITWEACRAYALHQGDFDRKPWDQTEQATRSKWQTIVTDFSVRRFEIPVPSTPEQLFEFRLMRAIIDVCRYEGTI